MYEATIEDPKVFTRPWKIRMPLYRRMEPEIQALEFKCVEFSEEFMYGHLIDSQATDSKLRRLSLMNRFFSRIQALS